MERVLRRSEVNWATLLTMITVSLRTSSRTGSTARSSSGGLAAQLDDVVVKILREAVANQNKDGLLAG